MSGADLSRSELLQMVVRVSLVSLVSYFSIKWFVAESHTESFRHLIVPFAFICFKDDKPDRPDL